MMRRVVATMATAAMMVAGTGTAWAQGPAPETRRLNDKLALTGIFVMIAGVAIMPPYKTDAGAEDFEYYGDDMCIVSTEYEFRTYDGPCRTTSAHVKEGLIVVGIGAALTTIGAWKVKVSPMIGPSVRGATVTIKWGGKK